MRKAFDEELQFISDQLVEMTRLASAAITRATEAMMNADLELAESVITADEHIDAVRRELDVRAVDTLARQQPVATDLRMLVTSMRMSSDLERMGDLARHVAKLTRLRYPGAVLPESLKPTFAEMAKVADRMTVKTGEILATSSVDGAAELHGDDDTIDELHRQVFAQLLSEDWEHGVEAAIDATLLSRYYERFADHAVSVAERVVYLVTGEYDADDAILERSTTGAAQVKIPRDGEMTRN